MVNIKNVVLMFGLILLDKLQKELNQETEIIIVTLVNAVGITSLLIAIVLFDMFHVYIIPH